MKIRPATSSDLPTIASIGAKAFADDLSYKHFFPWGKEYPKDFHSYLYNDYKRMLATPGQQIMVAELDGSDEIDLNDKNKQGEVGQIIAFATFIRSGGTAAELARWNPDSAGKSTFITYFSSHIYHDFYEHSVLRTTG